MGARIRRFTMALLYPGDRATRDRNDPTESRFTALFAAFAANGVAAEPAVYHDDFADEVAAQLRRVDAVLVWCNPIEGGRRRERLDNLLREIEQAGVFVSTHPDAILRLGTKDVLVAVRDLPFGSDAVRVDSLDQLAAELPNRLRGGARVLKQYRGHSGIGVWRVERIEGSPLLRVRHAQRGSEEEPIELPALLQRMAPYFESERLADEAGLHGNAAHLVLAPSWPAVSSALLARPARLELARHQRHLTRDRISDCHRHPCCENSCRCQ